MKKEKLLISSCLLGELVKYNGSHNKLDETTIEELKSKFELFPFCPEVEGGLPTPRVPCEIISLNPIKVIDKKNNDKTNEFLKGASKALELCKKNHIKKALLKSNSPSCSNQYIYDGTFSSNKIKGVGITVSYLNSINIKIYNEKELNTLLM
ncbi:MAG: DUF523 domain-containing protein [Campylobacterota bacterium]|nr:DUF523 domain-containing protein [Campylobacterota bacterium]